MRAPIYIRFQIFDMRLAMGIFFLIRFRAGASPRPTRRSSPACKNEPTRAIYFNVYKIYKVQKLSGMPCGRHKSRPPRATVPERQIRGCRTFATAPPFHFSREEILPTANASLRQMLAYRKQGELSPFLPVRRTFSDSVSVPVRCRPGNAAFLTKRMPFSAKIPKRLHPPCRVEG